MKKLTILPVLAALCAAGFEAFAQEDTDSIDANIELHEIVIEAPKVIRKADMDVLYPSTSAIENSKSGLQVLQNLMIPAVTVNDAMGTVTTAGGSVQLRINGREATVEQVRQLLPETVKRVEWIDNPGLRYNGATAVINFIVSNPAAGGSFMTGATPALNTAWGHYYSAVKLNNGHSQWGASVMFKNTNRLGSHRDYTETFTYPDETSVTRTETPVSGYFNGNFGGMQVDYSYIRPDTTTFWVALHGFKSWPSATMYNSRMTLNNGSDDILLHDYSAEEGFTPSIRAYFEQHFKHDQALAIDFSGSFYDGKTVRSYVERNAVTDATLTDVNTTIKDRNQVYGITADYIKKWTTSRLTVGASYTANRNRSVYETLGGAIFHQRQDKVYFYGEYFQQLNKFTLTAGLGAQYTSFRFRETDQGNASWNLRPQATVTYRHGNVSSFKLDFSTWQTAPSLSETNIVEQQIDGFQWQRGNPDVHTSSSYMLTFRYNFTHPRVMGQVGARAFTSPDAITPFYQWEGGKLLKSFENSKGLSNLTFWVSPQVDVIPGWLLVEGMLQYKAERMKGSVYELYNHNWSGHISAMLTHWNFTLITQYMHASRDLWGETLKWGENMSLVQLQYNWRQWQFGAGVICPFNKYDQGSKLLNKWNTNEQHMRLDMAPMPLLSVSYNLQWGRQKRDVQKLVNADADVQQSSAAGR